ncbi:MAG: sarcosine oxidase subunit gamma family protein, partial [Roseibium sp.]
RLSFRGRDGALAAAGKGFGVVLPTTPLSAEIGTDRAAFWLGPDEWLLIAQEDLLSDTMEGLASALGDTPHALVDISHRQDAMLLTGDQAAWLLNSGIPIDLHLEAFPVGMVTRTLFHKAPVMLWRIGPDTFVAEAWGSFIDYVAGLLVEAAQELKAA